MKRFLKNVLIVMATLVAFYYLARFTYHQGWWGRDNLIARSMWLCSGPPELEESFYPDNVEILISACDPRLEVAVLNPDDELSKRQKRITVLPSGRYIYLPPETLIDVFTGDSVQIKPTDKSIKIWLTDDLVMYYSPSLKNNALLRLSDRREAALPDSNEELTLDRPDGKFDEVAMLTALEDMKQVFVSDRDIIGLVPDFWEHPKNNINIFYSSSTGARDPGQVLESLLIEHEIAFQKGVQHCANNISPSGRFQLEWDGIYDTASDELLIKYNLGAIPKPGYYAHISACGWLPDESAIIFAPMGWEPPFVIRVYSGDLDFLALFRLPQPVLKYSLPQEITR